MHDRPEQRVTDNDLVPEALEEAVYPGGAAAGFDTDRGPLPVTEPASQSRGRSRDARLLYDFARLVKLSDLAALLRQVDPDILHGRLLLSGLIAHVVERRTVRHAGNRPTHAIYERHDSAGDNSGNSRSSRRRGPAATR
jgi:hypothetical protein